MFRNRLRVGAASRPQHLKAGSAFWGLALVVSLVLSSSEARADMDFLEPSLWLSPGPNIGFTHAEDQTKGHVGFETSLVFMFNGLWTGIGTDVIGDFERERVRMSVFGELGFFLVGVELGYTHEFGTGPGFRVGGFIAGSFLHTYVRHIRIGELSILEFGMIVKVPIRLIEF